LEDLLNQVIKIKKKTGFKMKDIAKEAGISERTIRRWIRGTHKPHPLHFKSLEKVVERINNFCRERGIEI